MKILIACRPVIIGLFLVREVEKAQNPLSVGRSPVHIDTLAGVIRLNPLKPETVIVLLPEGGMLHIDLVHINRQSVVRVMNRVLRQEPVLLPLLVPFTELSDLIAHEVELFARMCHHIHIQRSSLRELVRVIACHLLHDGCLSVNHLIMRQGKQIFFIIKILHGKGQLMVLCGTVLRRGAEIIQSVVHPPHVPLVVKSESSLRHGLCNARIGRRILRDQKDIPVKLL